MKRMFSFFLCFLYAGMSFSQQLPFRIYSLKEGLPHSQVYDVMQDSKGFLWVATVNGGAKFDGVGFKTYTQKEGLCSNRIRRIFEDSRQNIWFVSWDKGVTKYDGKSFITYNDTTGLVFNKCKDVLEDLFGNIWVLTTKGISVIDKNGKIKNYEGEFGEGLVYSLNEGCVSKDGTVWLTSSKKGLIAKNSVSGKQKVYTTADGLGNNVTYCVYEDKKGIIWVGHYGGFSSFDGKKFKQYKIPGDDNLNRVSSITEDSIGNLWMGLDGNGFVVWDKKQNLTSVNSGNGLPSDFIHELIIDREGNKWMASDGGGLIKFRNFSFSCYTSKEGLSMNDVQSIQSDKKGELWFAMLKGGISHFQKNRFINYSEKDGLGSDIVYNICIDDDDNKWVSTNSGTNFYDNKKFKKIPSIKDISNNLTYTSYYDKKSEYIYIGHETGLSVFDGQTYKSFYFPLSFPRGSSIRTMVKDEKGVLWIGTVEGLLFFNGDSISEVKELLPPDHLTYLTSTKDKTGAIWIGGATELIKILYKNGKPVFTVYNARDKFGLNGISALLIDNETMWVGAENKICKLDLTLLREKDSVSMRIITTEEDLLNSEINSSAITQDTLGNIWFGTFKGAFKYNPSEDIVNTNAPQTYITGIRLFSETFDFRLFADSVDASGNIPYNLVLPYDQNHLTFDYIGLCFSAPDKVKYKYRLQGFEEKWSSAVSERKMTYSFLEPGYYTFQLLACNNEGVWNKEPKEFSFTISSPYWKTWWFILMVIGTVLGILFLIFYLRLRTLKLEKVQQQNFTKQLIQSQESERKRIAKELHDSVGQNLLLVKNKLLLDNKNNNNSSENIMETTLFVDKTIEEVRAISRNLHPYQLEKLGLTKAVKSILESVSAATEIYFSDEIEITDANYSAEQQINIYRIIQESLNNILKHSGATAAKISMQEEEEWLWIIIQDNGKGFEKESIFLENKSLGLVGMEERARILNGTFSIETAPLRGTKYIIHIPMKLHEK